MKMWLTALVCAVLLAAQNYPAGERKHLSVPIPSSAQPLVVAAIEIDREGQYPSVVHLKGDVEIRIPVCIVTGPGTVQRCAGEIIFRADEADLHEDTGQIESKGAVSVIRK